MFEAPGVLSRPTATPDGTPSSAGRDVELLRAMRDRIDQQDPGAFNNLGVLYHARGLHAEAVDAFLRALALDPRMRTAARNLEVAATCPGACDERLAVLEGRIAADPDDRQAIRARAHLTRLIGRLPEAIRQLDALIAEDPEDAEALFERGLIEQRAGDLRRAQRWFERAVNAGAVSDARLHLAEVLYQRGQNEQALDLLDHLLDESPRHADAHLLRGFLLGDMGHHELAMQAAPRPNSIRRSRRCRATCPSRARACRSGFGDGMTPRAHWRGMVWDSRSGNVAISVKP